MADKAETNLSIYSDAIADRLKKIKGLTGDAKAAAAAFLKANATLQTLSTRAGAAENARDAGIEKQITLDVTRDSIVLDLANALVGGGHAKRANPFKGLSKYAPAKLVRLAYKQETIAVGDLAKAIAKKDFPANIGKLAQAAVKASAQVDAAVTAQDAPNRAHQEAFAARNGFLPEWQKAQSALRVQAKAALAKRPGAYEALFAQPDGAQRINRPRKKKTKPAAAATPAKTAATQSSGA